MGILSFLGRLFGSSGPPRPSPRDFVAQRDPSAPVLDVRTPSEFASGHLRGALNVDVLSADFGKRVEALLSKGTLKKDATVYLYCRSGNRSGQAEGMLRRMGFTETVNVGAIGALKAAGAEMQ